MAILGAFEQPMVGMCAIFQHSAIQISPKKSVLQRTMMRLSGWWKKFHKIPLESEPGILYNCPISKREKSCDKTNANKVNANSHPPRGWHGDVALVCSCFHIGLHLGALFLLGHPSVTQLEELLAFNQRVASSSLAGGT